LDLQELMQCSLVCPAWKALKDRCEMVVVSGRSKPRSTAWCGTKTIYMLRVTGDLALPWSALVTTQLHTLELAGLAIQKDGDLIPFVRKQECLRSLTLRECRVDDARVWNMVVPACRY
jgi:hypothetical protein